MHVLIEFLSPFPHPLPHSLLSSQVSVWQWIYPKPLLGGWADVSCKVGHTTTYSIPQSLLAMQYWPLPSGAEVFPHLKPRGTPVSASTNRWSLIDTVGLPRLDPKSSMASTWLCWGTCPWITVILLWGIPNHTEMPRVGLLARSQWPAWTARPSGGSAPLSHPSQGAQTPQRRDQPLSCNLSNFLTQRTGEVIKDYCCKLLNLGVFVRQQ